jgi:alkane 1-monooxygenase
MATGSRALRFYFIYLVLGAAFWLGLQGGWFTVIAPLGVTFVLVPIFDALIGIDASNPPEQAPPPLDGAALRLATWLAVPVEIFMLLYSAFNVARPEARPVELVGAVLSAGIAGGVIGITVAHELIHRHSRIDRVLGGVLLAGVGYLHWMIEHVAGHHRRVATPDDPATARLGEPLPAFLARSFVGGYRSAWSMEAARLGKLGFRWPLANRVLWCSLVPLLLAGALGLALGPRAAVFFVAQSLVAIGLLEIVNYIEHYGLQRRLVRPGVYERVSPLHSWNASHRLTNALLFNLQRHSDHHVWPQRPYHTLRHHAESPQLPLGYAGMALLALVPPLWRRVMDPRVAAHRARLAAAATEEEASAQ